ncbi:o-succinylbenzoate synthase [Aggregatimonas sangjinii]|uniref:o-succinylbenzoate synthase n=1 Tax=Aggregatimonas sangjinii TaxID=2583587 RepID=A0A5B7SPR1_9FLAO|nr:o-succinylbenzoate synthase [Aggregatimonas sangjinii]QCX00182.1 o-succinylbenzoate synthase [Aggregatimonas sangjinii]
MKAIYKKRILDFKRPSGTSRGVLTTKETYYIILTEKARQGIGECGLLKGLSIDDLTDYEDKLQWVCEHIHLGEAKLWDALISYPSIQFGIEQAFLSLRAKNPFILFPTDFTENNAVIPINGLIWMGEEDFMHQQIQQKLAQGFNCIKMKIGAIDFEREYLLLQSIRRKYSPKEIELRVDANGAFSPEEAMTKLKLLAELRLHSIEQPIRQGQLSHMKRLCAAAPLPIALDEELIGVFDATEKEKLLQTIQPQYIILKPSLVGGFKGSLEWIELAERLNIGWWVTSALESNIGLNAIAQWTFKRNSNRHQGLGTGSLFTNNFESPLTVENGTLRYDKERNWQKHLIKDLCI